MNQQLQKLLKIGEVALRLNCSESFVYNAIGDGSLNSALSDTAYAAQDVAR